MCSIPPGFNGLPQGLVTVPHINSAVETETFTGFTKEEIENARDHIIGTVHVYVYGLLYAAASCTLCMVYSTICRFEEHSMYCITNGFILPYQSLKFTICFLLVFA